MAANENWSLFLTDEFNVWLDSLKKNDLLTNVFMFKIR